MRSSWLLYLHDDQLARRQAPAAATRRRARRPSSPASTSTRSPSVPPVLHRAALDACRSRRRTRTTGAVLGPDRALRHERHRPRRRRRRRRPLRAGTSPSRPCRAGCADRAASKPMRTSTVAFWRSAVGTIVMTLRRNLPVGIRVEHRRDGLPGLHAVDVALVDVHFDLERPHVDDRADAGAREAAAGRDRRDHLARLRVLRDRDAAERRADDRVVEIASAASATCRSATLHLLARRARCARRASRPRPRACVDLGLRRRAVLDAAASRAPSVDARLGEPHFAFAHAARAPPRPAPPPAPAPPAASQSSSRASTWPSRTAMPSSTFTSTTLPVIFDETVARRRAVT